MMTHMSCQKICLNAVLFFSLFFNNVIFATGFVAGTLVKVGSEYVPIEYLSKDDQVSGLISEAVAGSCRVLSVTKGKTDKLIIIWVDDETCIVAPDQLFRTPQNKWIQACKLKPGDAIAGLSESFVIDNVEMIEACVDVYTLSVEDKKISFISTHDFAVFNFPNDFLWRTGGRMAKTAANSAKSVAEAWLLEQVINAAIILL